MMKSLPGVLAGLSAASIWGGMYVVSKMVLETIPPFVLVTSRLLLGVATLGLIVVWQHRPIPLGKQFWQIVLIGFIGYGISLGFQFYGTMYSTASNGAMVTAATPAFVLPIATLILGEQITSRRILSLALSIAGVILVINPFKSGFDQGYRAGNVYLVSAALTWALYSVLVRKMTKNYDVLTFSMIAFLGGLPVSVPLGIWELSHQTIAYFSWGILGGVLFLGIICTALAMVLWNTAFYHLKASTASLTFFAQPMVGTTLSILLLHETISIWFISGGILTSLGILLSIMEPDISS